MSGYKLLQMTNNAIGAVAVNGLVPLGAITRRIANSAGCGVPFEVTTSGADTVNLTAPGYYRITYKLTAVSAAAGVVRANLLAGGNIVQSAAMSAADGATITLNIPYVVRVFNNCGSMPTNYPMPIQIQIATTGIASGESNLIVERVA